MNATRFQEIAARYSGLRVALVGDVCLDRYLEIDPSRKEISIETGLPVHNVSRVRAQPGAAGTVLNNLVSLGVGRIEVVGFCGEDGEGYELTRAMSQLPGVSLEHFFTTPLRRTFTYCKPLILEPNQPPRELNRLDSKNWTPTPPSIVEQLADSLRSLVGKVDAVIVMDQVDQADTGVVTGGLLDAVMEFPTDIPVVADSRRSLSDYPAVIFKMNAVELATLLGQSEISQTGLSPIESVKASALQLSASNQRDVIITMAEQGLIGATPDGEVVHVAALPVRGTIDVVGAGDSVTANTTMAFAAGASLAEALEIASAASSVVVHQLGTTGSASIEQISQLLNA